MASPTPDESVQFFVRLNKRDLDQFKDRCASQGKKHSEVARLLLQEYGKGHLSISVTQTDPNLEEVLR